MKIKLFIPLIFCLFFNYFAFSQQIGNATYYNKKLQGRHTSDGGRYHPDSMTCAHKSYPLGTILKVRNPKNDREVIVKVTDRGPFNRKLIIDLSYSAAKELNIIRLGIAKVEVTRIDSIFDSKFILKPITSKVFYLKTDTLILETANFIQKQIPHHCN